MKTSDFKHKKGTCHFRGKTSIWNRSDTSVWICFDGHEKEVKKFLSSIIGSVNDRLKWIENNRALIENLLVDKQMIELTEEWIAKTEETEDRVYLLQDGQKVSLPLTKEVFCSSLYISGLEITYEEDEQNPRTDMYIHCEPSYLGEYGFLLSLNHDNSIDSCGILTEDDVFYYGGSELKGASSSAG